MAAEKCTGYLRWLWKRMWSSIQTWQQQASVLQRMLQQTKTTQKILKLTYLRSGYQFFSFFWRKNGVYSASFSYSFLNLVLMEYWLHYKIDANYRSAIAPIERDATPKRNISAHLVILTGAILSKRARSVRKVMAKLIRIVTIVHMGKLKNLIWEERSRIACAYLALTCCKVRKG